MFIYFFASWWSFYTLPNKPDPHNPEENASCYENTAMFLLTLYQYLVCAMAFSISKPFRQPIYTNLWFTASLVILAVFNIYITLVDQKWIYNIFVIKENITMEFRLSLLVVAFVNALCTYFYEKIAIWYISIWWRNRKERI